MKHPLTYFSTRHPVSVIMLVLSFCVIGFISVTYLDVHLMPVMDERYLLVSAEYAGLESEEMCTLVTEQIESSCASLKGVKKMSSVTRNGISLVILELDWGTDSDLAALECRELMDSCFLLLPSGCERPNVSFYSPYQKSCVQIAVTQNDSDFNDSRFICENEIASHLRLIKGVSNVSLCGGEEDEIRVSVNKNLLDSKMLTLSDIARSISQTNYECPVGVIVDGENEYALRTSALFRSLDDFYETRIFSTESGSLLLGDVAHVYKAKKMRDSFFLSDGKDAVCLKVYFREDASPVEVSSLVKEEVLSLEEKFSGKYSFKIIDDSSLEIKKSVKELLLTALSGALIAFLILYIFLHSFLLSAIVASVIPLSVLCSFIALCLFRKSLNMLSMAGITLALGMVIDSAIVVLENIQKKISLCKDGADVPSLVASGVDEVLKSTVASVLTTVVVFVPLFFLRGLMGLLFTELGIAMIGSLLSSAFFSLTYIPSFIVLANKKIKWHSLSGKNILLLERKYHKAALRFSSPVFALSGAGACVLLCALLILNTNKEVLPLIPGDSVSLTIECESDSTTEHLMALAEEISSFLLEKRFIKELYVFGGVDKDDVITLSDPSSHRSQLNFFIKTDSSFLKKSSLECSLNEVLSSCQYEYKIAYPKGGFSELLEKEIDFTPRKTRELTFVPDRASCAHLSLSASFVSGTALNAVRGVDAGDWFYEGHAVPIRVCYENGSSFTQDSLSLVMVPVSSLSVPLSFLGHFEMRECDSVIFRINRKPYEPSFSVIEDSDEFYKQSFFLCAIVLILLYCVIGLEFSSFKMPFLVFMVFPFSFFGAFFFLYIFRSSINIYSVLALLILLGTSVNNVLVLYEACLDYFKSHTFITFDSICAVCASKLRAVLLTTFTSLFSLFPFALNPNNSQSSLALAFCGGLIISLASVLFLFPSLLSIFFKPKGGKNALV